MKLFIELKLDEEQEVYPKCAIIKECALICCRDKDIVARRSFKNMPIGDFLIELKRLRDAISMKGKFTLCGICADYLVDFLKEAFGIYQYEDLFYINYIEMFSVLAFLNETGKVSERDFSLLKEQYNLKDETIEQSVYNTYKLFKILEMS